MVFDKEISKHMESRAEMLTKKHVHRENFGHAVIRLTVLMAKYIDKSSASFENKIPLLLKIPEIKDEAEKLNESFVMDSILFKKFRDLADFHKDQIIELQSRRKNEKGTL